MNRHYWTLVYLLEYTTNTDIVNTVMIMCKAINVPFAHHAWGTLQGDPGDVTICSLSCVNIRHRNPGTCQVSHCMDE